MITGTGAEYESGAASTKVTLHLVLTSELLGVFWDYLWENWLRCTATDWVLFLYLSEMSPHELTDSITCENLINGTEMQVPDRPNHLCTE